VIERLDTNQLSSFIERLRDRFLRANPAPVFDTPINPRPLSEFPDYSIVSFQKIGNTRVPTGWQECNGSKLKYNDDTALTEIDTPDLRGRFVQGAGTVLEQNIREDQFHGDINEATKCREAKSYPINGSGGRAKVTLGRDNLPEHSHKYDKGGGGYKKSGVAESRCGRQNYKNLKSDDTSFVGEGKPIDIMPPFYVLVYIIKQPANR